MGSVIARIVLPCLVAAALAGCTGPAAPDAAICQDVIHRLCLSPRCPSVDAALGVGDSCESTLLSRTGCGSDSFMFTSPPRDTVLQCRVLLLRQGNAPEQHPSCDDVQDFLNECGDVVAFLKGPTP